MNYLAFSPNDEYKHTRFKQNHTVLPKSCPFYCVTVFLLHFTLAYTENDEPQPQVTVAFGLRITNRSPSRVFS